MNKEMTNTLISAVSNLIGAVNDLKERLVDRPIFSVTEQLYSAKQDINRLDDMLAAAEQAEAPATGEPSILCDKVDTIKCLANVGSTDPGLACELDAMIMYGFDAEEFFAMQAVALSTIGNYPKQAYQVFTMGDPMTPLSEEDFVALGKKLRDYLKTRTEANF